MRPSIDNSHASDLVKGLTVNLAPISSTVGGSVVILVLGLVFLLAFMQARSPATETTAFADTPVHWETQPQPRVGPQLLAGLGLQSQGDSTQHGNNLAETVPVSITESGFEPQVVTVTVGAVIEWTNRTQETVRLVGGTPYRVRLPVVLRTWGGRVTTVALPGGTNVSAQQQDGWGSGDIPTGGTYDHAFMVPGHYPYFVGDDPGVTGLVVVEPILSKFTLGIRPPEQSMVQGQAVTYTVGVTATLGDVAAATLTYREMARMGREAGNLLMALTLPVKAGLQSLLGRSRHGVRLIVLAGRRQRIGQVGHSTPDHVGDSTLDKWP